MGKLEILGSLRGTITDSGINKSSNGNPQFFMSLTATEWYDEETQGWYDSVPADGTDITAYLVLFGKSDNPLFHIEDVMEVLGWDGKGFGVLNGLGVDTGIQFTVEENDYNGKITNRVTRIAKWDAVPGGRGVKRLSETEIAELDAKYGAALAKISGGRATKPASKKPKSKKTKATPPAANTKKPEGLTQDEAWASVEAAQPPEISTDQLAEMWLVAIESVGSGADQDTFTGEQWASVLESVTVAIAEASLPF